ncbi:related to Central kinetochore subunit CHL4 [Nakaseomyces glabratus]|nr:Kinetochore protein CHL4 like [Nakaseomyces glabratus]QNG12422.1 uncharacterized protein GWK60_B02519 [Nakaseomyces glabratus]SCV14674.1 related to Central kinetochore subunit CHL4 [Nakaseomyces glabratus]SLM13473.1 related to Central kinetochore subunit CHL4 [Nakaseomyces glabratus]
MELEDTYVPKLKDDIIYRKLNRLKVDQLCELSVKWTRKFGAGSQDPTSVEEVKQTIEGYLAQQVNKKTVIAQMMYVYWPMGLNAYQLAEIDCILLMERPANYSWKSKYLKNSLTGQNSNFSMNPKKFVSALKNELTKLYLTHFFLCQHAVLPVLILRIQSYDTNNLFLSSVKRNRIILNEEIFEQKLIKSKENQLISRKPYYLVFGINTPFIIHSPENDIYASFIHDCIERVLSFRDPIILEEKTKTPILNLEKILIMDGPSRYSKAMGQWSKYAEGQVETTPFGDIESHESYKGRRILVRKIHDLDDLGEVNHEDRDTKRLRLQKNMIRFKGSENGIIHEKIFEIKKKIDKVYNLSQKPSNILLSKYTSLLPIKKAHYTVTNDNWSGPYNKEDEDVDIAIIEGESDKGSQSISLKLIGNDIFGGLHELCDRNLIDIEHMPGWLTGENGASSGIIKNNEFTATVSPKSGII